MLGIKDLRNKTFEEKEISGIRQLRNMILSGENQRKMCRRYRHSFKEKNMQFFKCSSLESQPEKNT